MDKRAIIVIVSILILIVAFVLYRKMKKQEDFTGEKHEIILYFSPSCGHCHAFMGAWDKFAGLVNSSNASPVKAKKIDCTATECPNITGFPTVLLHLKNGKTVHFDGKRTVEDLQKFIANNS